MCAVYRFTYTQCNGIAKLQKRIELANKYFSYWQKTLIFASWKANGQHHHYALVYNTLNTP